MTYYSAFLEWVREHNGETFLCIRIPEQAGKLIRTRRCRELDLGVDDGRSITPAQRRKAYATLGDISNYTGYTVEAAKEIMKVENMLRLGQDRVISLSDCTITEAREYINTLMEYSLKEGLILTESGLKRTDDIDAYLIQCIRYRRCCICGKNAEIHHVDAIGMGNDRRHVDDSGKKIAALCRVHHTLAHQKGWMRFADTYKVYGIEKYRVTERGGEKEDGKDYV